MDAASRPPRVGSTLANADAGRQRIMSTKTASALPTVLGKRRAERGTGSIGGAPPRKRRRTLAVRVDVKLQRPPPPTEPENDTKSADAPKRTLRGKKKDGDTHERYVIQLGLDALCFNDETRAVIEDLVRRASQIAFEMSKLCQLYFHVVVEREWRRRKAAIVTGLDSNCTLPEIDRTFFDRVVSLVSSLENPDLPDDRVEDEELKLPAWARKAIARADVRRVKGASQTDRTSLSSSDTSNPTARTWPHSVAAVPSKARKPSTPKQQPEPTKPPKPHSSSVPESRPKPKPNSAAAVRANSKPSKRVSDVSRPEASKTEASPCTQPTAPSLAEPRGRLVARDKISEDSASESTTKPKKKKKIKVVTYERDLICCAALYKRLRKSSNHDSGLWASRMYLGDVLGEANMQLVTNFQNHVTTTFEARTRRYLHLILEECARSKNERQRCVNVTYDAIIKDGVIAFPVGVRSGSELHTRMTREVAFVRRIIGHQQLPVTNAGLARRWVHYLPWFYHIMAHIDLVNVERELVGQTPLRSFTLVPDRSLTPMCIAITPTVLRRCLLPLHWMHASEDGEDGEDGNDFRDKKAYDHDEIWNGVFRFNAIHGFKKRVFDDRILTDGVRCSVVFKRPLPLELQGTSPTQRQEWADAKMTAKGGVAPPKGKTRVVGLDPGGRDLFVAVEDPPNATAARPSKHIRMSTAEYYSIAGFTAARRKRKARLDLHPEIRAIESLTPTTKTSSFEGIQEHVRHVLTHLRPLMDYYHHPWHRRLAWKSMRGKKKAMHQACIRIAGKTPEERSMTAVGFGDGMFSGLSYKGHAKGPVKSLYKELRKYCHVDPVCEFRTSKLCHECQLPLQGLPRSEKEKNPPPEKTACERHFDRQAAASAWCANVVCSPFPEQGPSDGKEPKDVKDCLRASKVAEALVVRMKRWAKRKERLVAGRAIFGVRVCTTRKCAGDSGAVHRNRDVNAAKNILWLYRHGRTFRMSNEPRNKARSTYT